jgi:hypothetical protein
MDLSLALKYRIIYRYRYFLQSVITHVWNFNPDWIHIQMVCVSGNPYSELTFRMAEITKGETIFERYCLSWACGLSWSSNYIMEVKTFFVSFFNCNFFELSVIKTHGLDLDTDSAKARILIQ